MITNFFVIHYLFSSVFYFIVKVYLDVYVMFIIVVILSHFYFRMLYFIVKVDLIVISMFTITSIVPHFYCSVFSFIVKVFLFVIPMIIIVSVNLYFFLMLPTDSDVQFICFSSHLNLFLNINSLLLTVLWFVDIFKFFI
jgi:hypothetical protein